MSLPGIDLGKVSKIYVIADSNANIGPRCLEPGEAIAGLQGLGLFEGDLARDVNVKQMHLAMLGHQLSLGIPHCTIGVRQGLNSTPTIN